jgi:hypothetical protein
LFWIPFLRDICGPIRKKVIPFNDISLSHGKSEVNPG